MAVQAWRAARRRRELGGPGQPAEAPGAGRAPLAATGSGERKGIRRKKKEEEEEDKKKKKKKEEERRRKKKEEEGRKKKI